jgi:hypothetical protein
VRLDHLLSKELLLLELIVNRYWLVDAGSCRWGAGVLTGFAGTLLGPETTRGVVSGCGV